jgi:type III restriction enzyme
MADSFFERPILNSPYAYPDRHWELDDEGQPTNIILPKRRDSKLLTPVPKRQKRRRDRSFRDDPFPRTNRLAASADEDALLYPG